MTEKPKPMEPNCLAEARSLLMGDSAFFHSPQTYARELLEAHDYEKARADVTERALHKERILLSAANEDLRRRGEEVARLREQCENLETLAERHRKEIRQAQVQAELRNRQLDALGMVWCTGGCTGGMHRFTDAEVTESMIVDMATNVARAVTWWINRQGKGKPDYAERFARARLALERLVGEKLMDDLAGLQAEVTRLRARTQSRPRTSSAPE